MRPELIIFSPPVSNQYLSLGQCGEDLTVKQFIPQFAIECLYIPVLPGAARLDEEGLYTQAA
jgi:hypothetical protein